MKFRILPWVSVEQVNRFWSATVTPGRVATYSVRAGTLMTPPMLMPQLQTKTPTRGSWPSTSRSGGSSLTFSSVPRAEASSSPAAAAAAEASITDVGNILGTLEGPTDKDPRFVGVHRRKRRTPGKAGFRRDGHPQVFGEFQGRRGRFPGRRRAPPDGILPP